jgi:alpha-L-rhamnosidase
MNVKFISIASAFLCFQIANAQHSVDPTYSPKNSGIPFAELSASEAVMKHLELLPASARAVSGPHQISGVENLMKPDRGQVKIIPGVSSSEASPALLVDFGKELAGRLQIWGTPGMEVVVTTGESAEECVHEELALDNSGPFKLTLMGKDPAATPYSAFRYARISFPSNSQMEITRIVCDHKYYPVQYWGSFDCSDSLLTRIWYAGAYTAHLCMQEEIWDAPKRDRGLWIGDLQITGQTITKVFADRFLMEHSIAKVREEAQGGRTPSELPVHNVNSIPGYSGSWFCTLADFHRQVGDRKFLTSQHEAIISLLKYEQTQFDSNNLYFNPYKCWSFCDWSPGFVLDNPLTIATTQFYIIQGVHEAVYLLRELGDTVNAEKFAAWAVKLTDAARASFYTMPNEAYGNRLQMNIMAVLSGVATFAQCEGIYSRVLKPGSPAWTVEPDLTRHDDDPITPYYGYFLLQTMSKLNKNQDALNYIRLNWGDMLRRGATTWWEKFSPAWPEDMKWALDQTAYLSLCHGWSSGPTVYLTENVLGVRPTSPGYATVEIAPKLGDLKWAEGDVPTPNGVIHVRIDHQNDKLKCQLTLPKNVIATVHLNGKTVMVDHAGTNNLDWSL